MKIAIIAAAWLVAVAVIVVLFATERIEWPEVWLLGATFVASVIARISRRALDGGGSPARR